MKREGGRRVNKQTSKRKEVANLAVSYTPYTCSLTSATALRMKSKLLNKGHKILHAGPNKPRVWSPIISHPSLLPVNFCKISRDLLHIQCFGHMVLRLIHLY